MVGGAGPVDVDEVVRRDVRSWLIRGETSDSELNATLGCVVCPFQGIFDSACSLALRIFKGGPSSMERCEDTNGPTSKQST